MENINIKPKMSHNDSGKTLEESRIMFQFNHFVRNTVGAFEILNLQPKEHNILLAIFEAGYYYGKDTGHIEPLDRAILTNTQESFNESLTEEQLVERNMFIEEENERKET